MGFMHHSVVAFCCAALFWSLAAIPAEPPAAPILRIEAGSHTAKITGIATDADSRWLVTASEDKTLRIWDVQSGVLLAVLHPPLGEGKEGMLGAVTMSPNGDYIATGGVTGWEWDKQASIYIFERATGRMVHRISDLPDGVNMLAWTPDGRHLAAGLASTGIRIFRSGDYALEGQDKDFHGVVTGLDVSHDGRLVASCSDGQLRLYRFGDTGLQLLAKKAAPGGKLPFRVRFSPDGTIIAVGFWGVSTVNLLSADSLDFIAAPDITPLDRIAFKGLENVSWSADGRTLYSGGSVRTLNGRAHFLRAWAQGGRGNFHDLEAARLNISDIRPLIRGGVVFSSVEPSWGIFDPSGVRTLFVAPPTADFRPNGQDIRLSRDGLTVSFGFDPWIKTQGRFNLVERRYEDGDNVSDLLPRRSLESLPDAKELKSNLDKPKALDGQPLPLNFLRTESNFGMAADPEGRAVVLGSNAALRCFDREGRLLWKKDSPSVAWAINISADGRLLVAAYGDGTIRWHRMTDGQELAAFFPHADKKRWVLWTPSGYYDASLGADNLIGWHLNRGKDNAADFFPASRFRSTFYRPDVIAKIFSTLDEGEAVRLANLEAGRRVDVQPVKVQNVLPPVVEILSPRDGGSLSATSVTVKYNVRTPGDAPITGLRARVNGQAVSLSDIRNQKTATGGAGEVVIPISPQNSEIQLFAENRNGVSTPAVLRLAWAGKKAEAREEAIYKPKLYVLAVGVAKYANQDYDLDLAAKDARDFAATMQAQQGKLYGEVKVRLLTDAKATRDNVVDGLEWLKKEVTARDVGMMFLAGHGMNDNTGKYYFLPHNIDPSKLLRTGVPQTDIRDTLNNLAGKAVFFVDTCHSGNALGTAKTRGLDSDINAFVNELASAENGVVVFTAATGRQFSLEDPAWGNGAFTKAVVEGLTGKADFQKTGKITHKGLDYYVAERVKQLTDGKQSPVSISPAGVTDFPIAVVGR